MAADGRVLCGPIRGVAFRDSHEITMFTSESIEQRYMVYYSAANQTISRTTGDLGPRWASLK